MLTSQRSTHFVFAVALISLSGCSKSLLDDNRVSYKRKLAAIEDLGESPNATEWRANDELLELLYKIPDDGIVDVIILNKELNTSDCCELAEIGTLVYLRCGGSTFPSGEIGKIVAGNPNLRCLWLENCQFDLQPIDRICQHKMLKTIATHGSAVEAKDTDFLRACEITVVRDSYYSIRSGEG